MTSAAMLTNNEKLILNGEYFSPPTYNNVLVTFLNFLLLFAITDALSPLYLNMNAVQHINLFLLQWQWISNSKALIL